RYFNLGNIDFRDIEGQPAGSGNPREFSFDLGYSRELSENLSVGASLRYIHSNIVSGAGSTDIGADSKPANAIAADLGVFYTKTTPQSGESEGTFNAGAVLTNVGSKVTYSEREKDFLPTRLGLGAAYYYQIDRYNEIGFGIDLQKTLVPAPIQRKDENGDLYWDREYYRDMGVVKGIFESFTNAPKGYGTNIAVGAEYWYQQQFALRAGYYYEHKDNGNRQYLTAGLGIKYNVFGLNFSYLVPSGSGLTRNPLSNTLRFSLTFDFNELGKSEG
ncbi:MAG TPA: type IX secretion system outer membrane channel protein PorV, partial [Chitinophagaceae bacterium]|nr:type IX secretion system outer membrane channel protein PorV [Chitinophagaceae bacterium]